MSLKATIQNDIKEAMKNKEEIKRDALRMLWGEVRKIEIDEKIELDDTAMLKMVQKAVKQKDEALDAAKAANRADLIAKEEAERAIYAAYLPQQLSASELEAALQTIITQCGAQGVKDLGKVMKEAAQAIGSQADGKTISETAKRLLS